MQTDFHGLYQEAMRIWISGGWLMIPLLALTVFIYYTALDLLLRLQGHFLIRSGVDRMSDSEIAARSQTDRPLLRRILVEDAAGAEEVKRHFVEVNNEYLPVVNRRIKFLGIIITIGPLMGLLGTVTGMLTTFEGLIEGQGDKFQNVVHGISEALITTQTGLVISIPAMVILSLIVQRRNRLRRCIARLERYNTCLILKVGCPIPKGRRMAAGVSGQAEAPRPDLIAHVRGCISAREAGA